ncbi:MULTISPECIES: AraC family transcriptional regulator [Sphingobacterium]|uniref:AraC-like DNA-binding protein n=1 Tax=Sphingobacterium siyangense TaxID=459529 RepID=A0A562M6Q9_9SPHI|nr:MULTISPECIES: helix-turn-helix transcriptional regulator [Sphingobacterium]TWI15550.1 AraC-like DNA-binding protein [Sphingobacterium siyangense]
MQQKSNTIPLNSFPNDFNLGILIKKNAVKNLELAQISQAHRDDFYLFFILEEGNGIFEIDFQQHQLGPSSVMIIQPYQVHRGIAMDYSVFSVLMISVENLNSDYINALKDIDTIAPINIDQETCTILSKTVDICLKLNERKHEKLYPALMKDSCNTIAALIISQYLVQSKKSDAQSRAEHITKQFNALLDKDFITNKQPKIYAEKLKISTAYLNECIKKATGKPVTYHIQQRIVLEAKRLLYHSSKSVKEVAATLGYDDYPYFSRLFSKVTGMTALTFRNKNLE